LGYLFMSRIRPSSYLSYNEIYYRYEYNYSSDIEKIGYSSNLEEFYMSYNTKTTTK